MKAHLFSVLSNMSEIHHAVISTKSQPIGMYIERDSRFLVCFCQYGTKSETARLLCSI
jgi:hypothetical protein